jgi:hypothetical protein
LEDIGITAHVVSVIRYYIIIIIIIIIIIKFLGQPSNSNLTLHHFSVSRLDLFNSEHRRHRAFLLYLWDTPGLATLAHTLLLTVRHIMSVQ